MIAKGISIIFHEYQQGENNSTCENPPIAIVAQTNNIPRCRGFVAVKGLRARGQGRGVHGRGIFHPELHLDEFAEGRAFALHGHSLALLRFIPKNAVRFLVGGFL